MEKDGDRGVLDQGARRVLIPAEGRYRSPVEGERDVKVPVWTLDAMFRLNVMVTEPER